MALNFARPLEDDRRVFFISPDFNIQPVDEAIAAQLPLRTAAPAVPEPPLGRPDKDPAEGELGIALSRFTGTFKGRGLNMIFRPRNGPSSFDPADDPTAPGNALKDNLLEYDLTEEKLQFLGASVLNNVPNRGFGKQEHVNLKGTPYIQTVANVLNPVDVTPTSKLKTDIHFEPGLFMRVPALNATPGVDVAPQSGSPPRTPATITRMASIPHGTTINAQGLDPTKVEAGPPVIPLWDDVNGVSIPASSNRKLPTIPFTIDNPSQRVPKTLFHNTVYDDPDKFRIPQTVKGPKSVITQNVFYDPNWLLKQNNDKKNIVDHITFTVTTEKKKALQGGGTANIAFLSEPEIDKAAGPGSPPDNPDDSELNTTTFNPDANNPSRSNADAAHMEATFWISTVRNEIIIPPWNPKITLPICVPVDQDPSVQGPRAFRVRPNRPVIKPTRVAVHSTQIQYSQLVLLNFGPLSWPHISVATLVPDDPDDKNILTVDVDVDAAMVH
ncbi:uncharacterized protein PV09_05751 [Verruconis gallopava]|uniref:Uncharacterized protein n=1 Tax=Verruconis gallopava TaxID=253628 RepID=A0A0D1XL55_9PEZI|nr:uncharacterized protein PV09_05751 [Verruconis gallopava]KIW03106.1 hypothetical protein PV09_05751 [Verruconis gallopava]